MYFHIIVSKLGLKLKFSGIIIDSYWRPIVVRLRKLFR